MCPDSIFVVPKLLDLFLRIQDIVQQDYAPSDRDASAEVVLFLDWKQKSPLLSEWCEALHYTARKIFSWCIDEEDDDEEEDDDDDDYDEGDDDD